MDQVPRYFEIEPKTTIMTRGSREVLLKKGGTSHKRFTATFAITTSGIILKPHLLFSKSKNRPKCPDGVLVDVNCTDMWSEEILLRFSKAVVCSRKETQFYRGSLLYLVDSYACHVTLAESKQLERYNVFVVTVPPNLTSILQPLDVAVNRSYQAFYRNKCGDYISRALIDPTMQTAAENPKVPHFKTVAEWTLGWIASRQVEDIKKAFTLCGVVPKASFNREKLKDLLEPDLDMEKWHASYQHLLDEADDREQLCVSAPSCYLPDNERPSLFYCLLFGVSTAIGDFVYELVNYMKTLDDLDGLIDAQYLEDLDNTETQIQESWRFTQLQNFTAGTLR